MSKTEFQPIKGGDDKGWTVLSTPPSNAPVLFDVQGRSSTIKQRKDGSFKLVIKGVEQVNWKTSDASKEGRYSAIEHASNFDDYFLNQWPKSYQKYDKINEATEKVKFTIVDAQYKKKQAKLIYDIEPLNNVQADKIIGIKNESQYNTTVQLTEPAIWDPTWMPQGSQINLQGADLRAANLSHAKLDDADLRDADLRGAILYQTDFIQADLRGADLEGAFLFETELTGADLRGANLKHANLEYQDLSDADLTGVLNLDKAIIGPRTTWDSTICPDGSMTEMIDFGPGPMTMTGYNGFDICRGDQLIPLT